MRKDLLWCLMIAPQMLFWTKAAPPTQVFFEKKNDRKDVITYLVNHADPNSTKVLDDSGALVLGGTNEYRGVTSLEDHYIITVCYGDDNFSLAVLAQANEYCNIKRNLSPNCDIICTPMYIDDVVNPEEKVLSLVSCYKNGNLIFREVVDAAAIVRPAKMQNVFDAALGLEVSTNRSLPTKDEETLPERSLEVETVLCNLKRRD